MEENVKTWYKASACATPEVLIELGKVGISVTEKTIFWFRPENGDYLVKLGPEMIILSKHYFSKFINPIKENGEWKALRQEVCLSIEENIQKAIEEEKERQRIAEKEKQRRIAYEALSETDKKNHDKVKDARELISKLKTKKEKIIALYQDKSYTRQEIQQIVEADHSYMDEVYEKYINNN